MDIESLRGFAALFVVWHHLYVFGYMLDAGYRPAYLLYYGPSGHFCVLLFFILSGYVIGQSNREPLTAAGSGRYLKKRLVRLYPILLLTLLLAVAVFPKHYSLSTVLGNMAILQGLAVPDINPPSWSLHYEMVYYLLFILVSMLRLRPLALVGAALLVGFGNYLLYPALHTPILTSYCYGLVFWLLGLWLSGWLAQRPAQQVPYQVLLGCLFFVLCIDQYNVLGTLLRKYTHVAFPTRILWDQLAIEFYDLAGLPIALLIVLLFIGRRVPGQGWWLRLLVLALALPKLGFVLTHFRQASFDWHLYGLPTAWLLVALALLFSGRWLEPASRAVVRAGRWLGEVSYGLYLVHFPVLVLLGRIPFFSGSGLTFAVRVLVFGAVVVVLSYWLEQVMQPRIRAYFFPQPAGRPAPAHLPAGQELP